MELVEVSLHRIGPCAFEAQSPAGHRARVEGSPELRAKILERVADPSRIPAADPAPAPPAVGLGMRPAELFLVSLAGCAAMDVVLILTRQREDLRDLSIDARGVRADATPAVYERITLRFTAHGTVNPDKLARAADLAVTKYCSVASMLKPEIIVTVETALGA
jgi:putative redox protein